MSAIASLWLVKLCHETGSSFTLAQSWLKKKLKDGDEMMTV